MNENKIIIETGREETTKITMILIRTKSSAKARPHLPEMFTYWEKKVRAFFFRRIVTVGEHLP